MNFVYELLLAEKMFQVFLKKDSINFFVVLVVTNCLERFY